MTMCPKSSENSYIVRQKVMFKHCDPAGIVFYPRYFEMINDCVEIFFSDCLGTAFESMIPESGVPLVSIQADFLAPSRFGDNLQFRLTINDIGRTSLKFALHVSCASETRFTASGTIVHVLSTGVADPWPPALRERITAHMKGLP